jgi:CHAD domain-containing protein
MTSTRRYDLLRTRLDSVTRMLPGVESGEVGAVHRMRVASRRLRELLPILQLDSAVVRKMNRRLRKVTRRLGTVRELDALLLLIDELHGTRPSDKALRRIVQTLRKARHEAGRRLTHKDVAGDLRRLEKKLEGLAADLDDLDRGRSRGGWRWAIDARVAHRASLLKEAIREAGSMYVPDRIHSVRLAIKKLRYGLELSAEAAGVKETPDLRALKRGQELLGRLRDLQVLMERVRREQAAMTPPDLAAWRELDALVATLENNCRRLHARYVRRRTTLSSICDRLSVRAAAAAARRVG